MAQWRHQHLDGRVGLTVMASGVALCVAGTLLEPRARPDVEYAWWAQLLACVFWAGACGAAAGVVRRRRAGLLGALAAATSFTVAAAIVPFVTRDGATLAWCGEMVCATTFVVIVLHAMRLSRPAPRPALVAVPDRALA